MKPAHRTKAFTLIEMMVSTAILASLGGIIYAILNSGLILFSKNTALNVAHQQARIAVLRMEHNLHSSISPPRLVDVNRDPVSGEGPAEGIAFQLFAAGPFAIPVGAAAGSNTVTVALGAYAPRPGQRLIVSSHGIASDIAANDPGTSGTRPVILSGPIGTPIAVTFDAAGVPLPANVTCFIADRAAYVVKDGTLRYFGPGNATGDIMATGISSSVPFGTPVTGAGTPNPLVVAAINLSSVDSSTSNRGFKSANMFLNSTVPVRGQLINSR